MHSRLEVILDEKRTEVARLKKRGLSTVRSDNLPPIRDFKGAISRPNRINLIAEIKFASPSTGIILKDGDPVQIARIYQEAGAGAVSLLTDKRFFNGDINHLPRIKSAISLPVLRKDFIVDPIQVDESLLHGADAILLIVGILSRNQVKELLAHSRELGMACLTEVHNRHEIERAVECGAEIIGINNRDLGTFEVNMDTTLDLAPLIQDGCVCVSESGISNREDIGKLRQGRINAVLVGTALMISNDLMAKTGQLVQAGGPAYGKG